MMTAALQRHFWVACVLALVAPSSTKALEQEILSPDMAQAMQVAQSHCDALLKEGGAADFRILLGRQAHRLSAQEIQVFEEAFTRKLWRDAGSLPAAGSCRLERHDVGGVDENGLPLVSSEDDFLGNPYPDFTAAVRNTFKFKGISLTALLDIREGGVLWNGTYARLSRIGRTQESADGRANFYVIDGVKEDGSPNDTRISAFDYFRTFKGDGGGYAVENAIQDGSWLRLREVTLSYDLPRFANFVEGVSVYFTGRNLWLKTDYLGVDPETSLTGAGSNVGGFDYFNMPGTRSYIVGLRANF